MINNKKPELLAPAGDKEKLEFALHYGADAVYVGGTAFSLRANAVNFDIDDIIECVKLTHNLKKKIYLTVNIFAHNRDIDQIAVFLKDVAKTGVDALIISDPGVFLLAKQFAPGIPIHISTQANNTNWLGCEFWKEQGAKRVVLARELSLDETKEINEKSGIETEIFIHGAMCVSYSGRCLLSNYLLTRDANQGDCAHPCRWNYRLVEEKRPGNYLPIEEDNHGTYILNTKDLCLLPHLPEISQTGVSSLKIEGRNKSAYYVANVTRVYREALDVLYSEGDNFYIRERWLEELAKVSHREYCNAFAFHPPGPNAHRYDDNSYVRGYDFAGIIKSAEEGFLNVEQRNNLRKGDEIEIILPDGKNITFTIDSMINEKGEHTDSAPHPKEMIKIKYGLDKTLPLPLIIRRKTR